MRRSLSARLLTTAATLWNRGLPALSRSSTNTSHRSEDRITNWLKEKSYATESLSELQWELRRRLQVLREGPRRQNRHDDDVRRIADGRSGARGGSRQGHACAHDDRRPGVDGLRRAA